MTLKLQLPEVMTLKPRITVFGVGGAGGNAVNNMVIAGLEGVNFVVANTDAQALENALPQQKIQLGTHITRGLGAGSSPEVGRAAAEESMEEIHEHLKNSNMVFITAGMGGGTGTGAASVIARLAKEAGILTVAVVTKPFHFEGAHRMRMAEFGLQELQKHVDTLIVIPNQNLFRIANEKTTFADAFKMADNVLHSGVRSITDLMMMPGLINLDFADVRTVMSEMGKAMMGTGEAEGENRAVAAAEAAIANPLLDNVSMKGARGVLINITGGLDMTLFEVDEAANRIRDEVDPDANIIFGSAFNEELNGRLRVSVVATGIDAISQQGEPQAKAAPLFTKKQEPAKAAQPAAPLFSERPAAAAPAASFSPVLSTSSNFIPPRPVEPAHYPAAMSAAHQQPQQRDAEVMVEEEDEEDSDIGGVSLFTRPHTVRKDQEAEAAITKAMQKAKEETPAAADMGVQDSIFDIPAFLRRKN